MAKRGAETSLTKNNWQQEDEGDEPENKGEFAEASADKLAARTFVKVRRKESTEAGGAEFKLGSSEGSSTQAFNFDFTKPEAPSANTPAATETTPASSDTAKPQENGFERLMNRNNWECTACEVSNKQELTKCAACETPRPGTTQPLTGAQTVAAPALSSPNPAPFNAFAALMNPDNWECPACEVSNKKDLTKCAACEAPKPGTEMAAATSSSTTALAGGFTFGTTAPFTFGSSTVGTGGFTFGSTTPSTWNFSSMNFGKASHSDGTPDSPFTFGSGAAPVTFGDVSGSGTTFGTGTPTSFEPTDQLATGGDQTKEEFKNKAPEPSGTDKDVTIFKIPTTVYVLTTVESKPEDGEAKKETKKFVECGEGELRVNTIEDGDKKLARVVLRVEKTQRLVLNAPLFFGMNLGLQGDKYVKFASNDLDNKPAVYLLRFKNKTETTQVKEHMDKAVAFTNVAK